MDSHGQWLRERLDEWTAEGLIPEETAEALRARCPAGPSFVWTGPLFAAALVCLAAGLAFTGAGLWGSLPQDERFLLAAGPLAVSVIAAALFLLGDSAIRPVRHHGPEGEALPAHRGLPVFLREGVGIFHGLALTAAVWMVHDSFLLDPDMSGLAAGAALCLLMMLYLLRSAGLGVIFAADTAWAAWLSAPYGGWTGGVAWVLLAAGFPLFFLLISEKRQEAGIAYAWGWIAAVLALTFFTASEPMWQVVFFSIAASLTWLIGSVLRAYGWIGAAFRFFGGAAVFGGLLAAAFGSPWRGAEGSWYLWVLLILFLAADGVLLLRAAGKKEWLSTAAGVTPFVLAAAALLALWDRSGVSSAVLVSCFIVFLAAAVIGRGLQKGRRWQMASGLLFLMADGVVRLWDSSLSFGQRGAFFLVAGLMAALLCVLLRPAHRKARPHRRHELPEETGGDGDA